MTVGVSGLPLYFNSEEGPVKFSGVALKGSFGVFVSNHFSIENNLFYYRNNDVFTNDSEVQSESYGLQISLRYHYPLGEKISIYGDLGFGFGSVSYTDNSGYRDYNYYSVYNSGIVLYTVGIGTLIKLYKRLDFEMLIPYLAVYNTNNENNIYGNERGNLLYGAMAGPNIGLRYRIK